MERLGFREHQTSNSNSNFKSKAMITLLSLSENHVIIKMNDTNRLRNPTLTMVKLVFKNRYKILIHHKSFGFN